MRGFRGGFMGGIGIAVAAAAAMVGAGHIGIDTAAPAPSHNPRRRRRQLEATSYGGGNSKTTWHPMNGQSERERRMRQIAAGSLRVENGLVR